MITIPKNAPLNIVASPRTLKYAAMVAIPMDVIRAR
jgi:hypothetical protein